MIHLKLAFVQSGQFEKIKRFYLIRGLPYDRVFRDIKRSLIIYIVQELKELIVNASNKLKMNLIDGHAIIKKWWPAIYKKTCFSAEILITRANQLPLNI